jgi:large subunit ribosomal protein L9
MKIILLKDINKIGRKYEIKNVSDGHAINLLIPQGLAVAATGEALKRVEREKATMEINRKVREDLIAKNIADLKDQTVTISGKANAKGHLFAGLHADVIAKEVEKQTRLQIDPEFIKLDHPLKEVGEHIVEVSVGGKTGKFKLVIEGK